MSRPNFFSTLFSGGWFIFNKLLDGLTPVGDLIIRFWIARVFFFSGLTKIQSWDSTVMLFTHEYEVPFLSPTLAAFMGTGVELAIPVLLILGLGSRLPAFILFVFNILAVVSYPFLLTDAGAVGLKDHIYWGMLIMVLMLHGTGKLSLDYLIAKWRPRALIKKN